MPDRVLPGLAGLRVGYGAFPAGLVTYLWRAKQPYNVSVAAEVAGVASLSDPQYLEVSREAAIGSAFHLCMFLDWSGVFGWS